MKKIILLSLSLLVATLAVAQTQKGFVKTKGRMVYGQLVPGHGLPGATVNIQGGSSVGVSNADGSFSFVVPARTFLVQSVQKKGYELVDPDITTRPHQQSENALYLVMETPEQQMEDQLEAEEKISRTLREQLTRARREITRLKEENKITEEEYNQRIAKLMEDQKNNKTLIEEMARQYAQMDYDQMDSLNQRISDAILNGRLTEADSLLRSKGDIRSRIAEIRREQLAEAQREAELAQELQDLDASKAGTQKMVEEIAADCYRFFDNFKLANQYDSAAYYIELRAELDTTNAWWQSAAAYYLQNQNQFESARLHYEKALNIFRRLDDANFQVYDLYVAQTQNNLASLYKDTQRFAESETMYKEALETLRRLAKANPKDYEPFVATTLNDLALLYRNIQRFSVSEEMFREALKIYTRLAETNPQAYEPNLAWTLDNLAGLYSDTQRVSEGEEMFREALEIRRRLANVNPKSFEHDLAWTLNNLAILYSRTQHFAESEEMYREALEIRRHLAESNPQAYEPDVATTLNNLAVLYSDTQRLAESEEIYREALEIRRRLAEMNPQAYEPDLAWTLNNLASLYSVTQRFAESEEMHSEALEIRRHLAEVNPQAYEPDLAWTLNNLADLYGRTRHFAESEKMYREALEIRRRLAEVNYKVYEPYVAWTLNNLAMLYSYTQRFAESEEMYKEALEIRRRLAEENPLEYEPHIAQTLFNIGLLKFSTEHFEEAIPPFEEALEIYRRISKVNSSQRIWYVNSLDCLGRLYNLCKFHDKAYQIGEELLPKRKEDYNSAPEQYKSNYAEILGNQSCNCIRTKQFAQAEQYAREGLQVDSTKHFIYANLAASLLFQGKYEEAEHIYRQYKEEFKEGFLDDFRQYAEEGVIPKKHKKKVERIKQMLEE